MPAIYIVGAFSPNFATLPDKMLKAVAVNFVPEKFLKMSGAEKFHHRP